MPYFLNVNCRYVVILYNKKEFWADIEACFATVKYSIYCKKTRQMTFKKYDIRGLIIWSLVLGSILVTTI
jgi:hypothetical protein